MLFHVHCAFLISFSTLALAEFSKLQINVLNAHNAYRKKHSVGALTLSEELNNYAQKWADRLAEAQLFEHRTNSSYGENLFESTDPKNVGIAAVDAWYKEISIYDYNNPGFTHETGHFTQLVWKASKKLGVAKAKSKNGFTIVVANYDPPGNVIGCFKENVLPSNDNDDRKRRKFSVDKRTKYAVL